MVTQKHIHKYERKKLGKSIIYKCALSGCTHFIQKTLVEGRTSICSRCESPFTITAKALKYCPAKPHCDNCYRPTSITKKESELDRKIDDILSTIIVD